MRNQRVHCAPRERVVWHKQMAKCHKMIYGRGRCIGRGYTEEKRQRERESREEKKRFYMFIYLQHICHAKEVAVYIPMSLQRVRCASHLHHLPPPSLRVRKERRRRGGERQRQAEAVPLYARERVSAGEEERERI